MDEIKFFGANHPEDVKWLCSLSESELDMLISLKKLALQRAKAVGHESLAQKFDLKMLRALGFILMQQIKGKVNDLQVAGLIGSNNLFDGCNLLKLDLEDRVKMGEQAETGEQIKMVERAKAKSSKVTPMLKRKRTDN